MRSAGLESSGPALFLTGRLRILIVLIVALAIAFAPVIPAISISEAGTGAYRTLFIPARGQEFYVEFTHSVNKTNVREYYEIIDGTLLLMRAEYSSFGVGMPETGERPGSTLTLKDGILHLDALNQPLPSFIYRVGTVAEHTLHINNHVIPLKSIAPPQTALEFEYRRITVYEFLRRLNRSE